jgi:hypothetical protein
MDDKKGGRTCTRLKWPEVTHEEKGESQPADEREDLTKRSL